MVLIDIYMSRDASDHRCKEILTALCHFPIPTIPPVLLVINIFLQVFIPKCFEFNKKLNASPNPRAHALNLSLARPIDFLLVTGAFTSACIHFEDGLFGNGSRKGKCEELFDFEAAR